MPKSSRMTISNTDHSDAYNRFNQAYEQLKAHGHHQSKTVNEAMDTLALALVEAPAVEFYKFIEQTTALGTHLSAQNQAKLQYTVQQQAQSSNKLHRSERCFLSPEAATMFYQNAHHGFNQAYKQILALCPSNIAVTSKLNGAMKSLAEHFFKLADIDFFSARNEIVRLCQQLSPVQLESFKTFMQLEGQLQENPIKLQQIWFSEQERDSYFEATYQKHLQTLEEEIENNNYRCAYEHLELRYEQFNIHAFLAQFSTMPYKILFTKGQDFLRTRHDVVVHVNDFKAEPDIFESNLTVFYGLIKNAESYVKSTFPSPYVERFRQACRNYERQLNPDPSLIKNITADKIIKAYASSDDSLKGKLYFELKKRVVAILNHYPIEKISAIFLAPKSELKSTLSADDLSNLLDTIDMYSMPTGGLVEPKNEATASLKPSPAPTNLHPVSTALKSHGLLGLMKKPKAKAEPMSVSEPVFVSSSIDDRKASDAKAPTKEQASPMGAKDKGDIKLSQVPQASFAARQQMLAQQLEKNPPPSQTKRLIPK